MSQINEIHPQLGAPPAPMTEEGTTGAPAATDRIDDQVAPPVGGSSDRPADAADVEDDVVVFADPEDDGLGLDDPVFEEAPADERSVATDEPDVVTEEYSVTDEPDRVEDPTPADVPVTARDVPADDGTAVEDADVETTSDAAPPAGASAVAATGAGAAAASVDAPPVEQGRPAADDDFSIGHVFDQTNGVVDGLEGDSDGTADGEERSDADRHGLNQPNPVGQQDAFLDDHYGTDRGRDVNP